MSDTQALHALIIDPPQCVSDHTWNNAVRACIEAIGGEAWTTSSK